MQRSGEIGKWLVLWGHIIRGWIYFVTGILALGVSLGWNKTTPTTSEVLYLFGQSGWGKILLALEALGLVGYAIWGFIRTRRAKSWVAGIGYLSSMIWYLALAWPMTLLLTTGRTSTPNSNAAIANLIANPTGRWLALLIGIIMAGAGAGQIITATKDDIQHLARIGLFARGVLIALAGGYLISESWRMNTNGPMGTSQILMAIYQWKFGSYLVGFLGAGLAALGLYSFSQARNLKWPYENTRHN